MKHWKDAEIWMEVCIMARDVKDTRKNTTHRINHKGLKSLTEQLWSLQGLSPILSMHIVAALLGVFVGLLTVRM